jgi:DNA-binding IclR family transcriptional regulator
MSLTEITETLQFPYSTAHRLLATLSEYHYVQRDLDTKRYFLGLHVLELQANISRRFRLLETAVPHMTSLVQDMSVTCHLAVLHGADIIYLESRRSYGDPLYHLNTQPGRTVSAHCTALGKALLAHLPADVLARLLPTNQLARMTPNTIVDPAQLARHLTQVKRCGYAVDNEEYSLGVRCIAAPIRCRTGEVIAALSISGSKDQVTPEKEQTLASRVMMECAQLSRELGFVAAPDTDPLPK